ncbi:uncharacterized protein N7483_001688 [Penicillium malachiteum]|uniref:uncharacterized protein n=1 Tax=Penicillium malachiteum TaxID=1324776 RepID=UPI0025496BD0|nr:uncharacterized protein N7483_001688 [Penicillium malachiteum]KAJ5736563.1 hypothetical protein N7483_001688 [Penicillium malachiteum]
MSIDSASVPSSARPHTTQSESAASSGESNAKTQDDSSITQPTKSTILSSILSPFSSLLSVSSTKESEKKPGPESVSTPASEPEPEPKAEIKEQEEEKVEIKEPEPYYTPNEVPKFKLLQKKRLSGTRTKQLLRAAGRAYNDPPPQPELGMCCGSSCDPCVNDLWREEREVWRERWGDSEG